MRRGMCAGRTLLVDSAVYRVAEGKHLVVVAGMRDVVVVHTGDATLVVCPKGRTDEVKKLVEEMRRRKMHGHL